MQKKIFKYLENNKSDDYEKNQFLGLNRTQQDSKISEYNNVSYLEVFYQNWIIVLGLKLGEWKYDQIRPY